MIAARGAGTLRPVHRRRHNDQGVAVKRQMLTAFRAFAFAIGCFILMALGGIKVRSAGDVTLFVLGLAAFWVLIEKVFLNLKTKQAPRKF